MVSGVKEMVILFDQYHLPEDVYEILFATEQQRIVGKVLIKAMKENHGKMNKTEMSFFATQLHDGDLVAEGLDEPAYKGKKIKLSYNKRQFYDRILTPMRAMGMVDYDMYKKVYLVSDRFCKALTKISVMWQREVKK